MRFLIMNKHEAADFYAFSPYAVIGVVSHYDTHPTLQEGFVDALRLKFYDTDFEMGSYPAMTSTDAVEILEFVEKTKNKVDYFVIHCNAGISRSSGIAAALSLIYNKDDKWVFSNPRYVPNMLVYRKILSAAAEMGLLT